MGLKVSFFFLSPPFPGEGSFFMLKFAIIPYRYASFVMSFCFHLS